MDGFYTTDVKEVLLLRYQAPAYFNESDEPTEAG